MFFTINLIADNNQKTKIDCYRIIDMLASTDSCLWNQICLKILIV